jgi:hypothetical protein
MSVSYNVTLVNVMGRTDCCTERLANYSVYIGDDSDFTKNPTCGNG